MGEKGREEDWDWKGASSCRVCQFYILQWHRVTWQLGLVAVGSRPIVINQGERGLPFLPPRFLVGSGCTIPTYLGKKILVNLMFILSSPPTGVENYLYN